MKKLTVLLVAFVALLSSAFASDWHFWGKDLDQHPEFLWGFFPTYLYGGVGYTGFEFIPGHTTDIQLMAGAGYVQRKLFQKYDIVPIGSIAFRQDGGICSVPITEGESGFCIAVAAPVISEGDIMGCVLFAAPKNAPPPGEVEHKLAQTVAAFLGKQMES